MVKFSPIRSSVAVFLLDFFDILHEFMCNSTKFVFLDFLKMTLFQSYKSKISKNGST